MRAKVKIRAKSLGLLLLLGLHPQSRKVYKSFREIKDQTKRLALGLQCTAVAATFDVTTSFLHGTAVAATFVDNRCDDLLAN